MRLITWPVDMLAVHLQGKAPRPVRFRYRTEENEEQVVKVEKILRVEERNLCGDRVIHYCCENGKGRDRKTYRLQYILNDDKWEMYMEK